MDYEIGYSHIYPSQYSVFGVFVIFCENYLEACEKIGIARNRRKAMLALKT